MEVRRVVTGHDTQGKARFVSDTKVSATTLSMVPGVAFHQLWGAEPCRMAVVTIGAARSPSGVEVAQRSG